MFYLCPFSAGVNTAIFVALGQSVWASVGVPKIGGRWVTSLKMGSVFDPPETRPSPVSVTTANLVVLRQTVGAYCGDPTEKFDTSLSAFQGPSRSLEPTRIDPSDP